MRLPPSLSRCCCAQHKRTTYGLPASQSRAPQSELTRHGRLRSAALERGPSRWAVVTPCSECVDEREDFSADLTHLVSYSVVRVTQAQWSSSVQPYAQQRVRGATRPVARAERCVTGRVVFQHVVLHRACLATVCHNEWARRALSEGEPWRYRCGAGRSSEHDTQGDISLPSRLLGDDRKTPLPLHRATTGGRTEGLSERASKRANVVYVGAREGMREKASGAGTE